MKSFLEHEELLEKLDWLAQELKQPADLTIHTESAKKDIRRIIYTCFILAIACKPDRGEE